jgi:hypothetical protein
VKNSPTLQFLALVMAAAMLGMAFFFMFMPRLIPDTRDPRCDTGARYEAMREAHEQGRPFPC